MENTELKTLKDFVVFEAGFNDEGTHNFISKTQIKQEAIKWYKEIFQYGEDSEEFKDFFNITEEELK